MDKIRRGTNVTIDPDFIERFSRLEFKAEDVWKVTRIDPMCNGHIAHLANCRTGEKVNLPIRFLIGKSPS